MGGIEPFQIKLLQIENIISLCSAVVTCTFLIGLGIYKYQLIDRVTLRIQGIIALIDIARHLSMMQITHSNNITCQLVAFSVYFTDHLYILLNVAIALNIHRIMIQNKRPRKRLQWIYMSVSVGLAAFINFIPLVSGKFKETSNGWCQLNAEENTKYWRIFLLYLSKTPGTIYCLIIYLLALKKLCQKEKHIRLIKGSENTSGSNQLEFIWTLYSRISLYPLSCFITLFPLSASMFFMDITGIVLPGLPFLVGFFLRITGFLNFVTMLCDPHCQIALQYLLRSVIASKPLQDIDNNFIVPSIQLEESNPSTPFHDEIEFPNGDRIQVQEYIRLL